MSQLSYREFLKSLPDALLPQLPPSLQDITPRQPFRWIVQFHYGDPTLHYEVSRAARQEGWELGFHCESRDKQLNRVLLNGFRRHLVEIKDTLGDGIEAEMWDRGWTKVYEVFPAETLDVAYQQRVAGRLAAIIGCLQPIFVELRHGVR